MPDLYFVGFSTEPTRYVMSGQSQCTPTWEHDVRAGLSDGAPVQVHEISRRQWDELRASEEPSQTVAAWFGLPYNKRLPEALQGTALNIVEFVANGESGCDQPCRFGNRVEDHAVYCHNHWWVDAPRKCRRTWYTGGKVRDEDCPGFEPHALSGAAATPHEEPR